MTNDKVVGGGIFGGSVAGIVIYAALLWYAPEATLQMTAFLAVVILLGILAWIGYTMVSTLPPEPLADSPPEGPEPKTSGAP